MHPIIEAATIEPLWRWLWLNKHCAAVAAFMADCNFRAQNVCRHHPRTYSLLMVAERISDEAKLIFDPAKLRADLKLRKIKRGRDFTQSMLASWVTQLLDEANACARTYPDAAPRMKEFSKLTIDRAMRDLGLDASSLDSSQSV